GSRQVYANTAGSSTRSTRMSTVMPPAKVIVAVPPGRRSMVARSPNHALRPSAVVSACHTSRGACVRVKVRSMRSGNGTTSSFTERPWMMASNGRRPGDRPVKPGRSPVDRGSAVLLGGAAGEVAGAAVGGAGAALGQFTQAGADEVIPASAAHVFALEFVVQTAVLERELAGVV